MKMKTIGQILKQARQKKSITISQLSTRTKIRPDYIKAIERDHFHNLPSATFVKGFIRNLALSLDLPPDTALAIFRRDYDQDKAGKVIPRGLTQPLKTPSRLYNPKTTTIATIVIAIFIISIYFYSQLVNLTNAPSITLNTPAEEMVTGPIVRVQGSTSSDATLTINQQPVSLNINGQFETTLDLSPGEHTLIIQATSRDGKIRTLERRITVEPN